MHETLQNGALKRERAWRALRAKLLAMSPAPNLLCELMGFGHFRKMAMTRDGLLIAEPYGCIGFDAFIGSPTTAMRASAARVWLELSCIERNLVLERLAEQDIAPDRIGINVCQDCGARQAIPQA